MINHIKYIKSIFIVIFSAILLTGSNAFTDDVTAQQPAVAVQENLTVNTDSISAITIVNSPSSYLNKNVVINAKFDKFSTLGLDYKSAYRSSEEYISFLILRDDVNYEIPLSEMKLFMKRDLAEKNIELKTNDEIQIVGKVFSDALGDAWIDVESLIIIKKASDNNGVK